ncbi:MAG: DUF1080 domain-containing protein [Candidatus Anammoximicrobium sp.]|nr:DUF1080 domain-containing protein [Candidatus Anammoximicrobium sp.]
MGCSPGEPSPQAAANPPAAVETAAAAPEQTAAEPAPKADPEPVLLGSDELAEGWISLFDGQTLFGWKADSQADWRVEDGTIVVGAGEKGLLGTTTQFCNYVLRVDFNAEQGTNSGIFLHTVLQHQEPATDCYELNIAESDNPFPTGSLVQRQKAEVSVASGQWHSYEVTVDGDRVLVKLDGQQVLDYTDPKPLRRGHIGLQLNSGRIAFRNIRLKPLGVTSLFNGRDLTGWKTYPQMASKFTVSEAGELHVENGRGQLESEGQYADFALQLECQTHAPRLNSGVFFRCIPGEEMNGYECQIHNGFQDDDRTKPQDCGTGGFFRRQNARRVVADDLHWFSMTLIADGAHMAAWVNGYQVSDWTDDRPANENPRKGLRLEPGTIMIQGHDPTTDISFRNLRIAQWAPRGS